MIDVLYWALQVLIEQDDIDQFIEVFELLGHPPKIIVGNIFMTALRFSYENNCCDIFKYLMTLISHRKLVSTFSDRLLILKSSFVSRDEKLEALENSVEVINTPVKF